MRLGSFLLGLGAGLVIYHYWNRRVGIKNPEAIEVEAQVRAVRDVLTETANSYSNVLKQDYDIFMPSDQISKKVRVRAKQLTDGRYSEDLERQKAPLSL